MSSEPQKSPDEPHVPRLAQMVRQAIAPLQKQVTGPNAHASGPQRATMAALRSAVGRSPADVPLAWAEVAERVFPDFPEHWLGDQEPRPQEWAAFTALTFWALHQQSQERAMHSTYENKEQYKNFGHSVGLLAREVESNSLKSRFDALLVATGEGSQLNHLRGLIQLLRAHEVQVDYGQLAEDLLRLRRGDHRTVALRWGRGFAQASMRSSETASPKDSSDVSSQPA